MSKLSLQLSRIKARLKEAGNVLFMILIAVALFAALAYAVTNSTRSGGGDASREQDELIAAQVAQYGAELQMSTTRMKISNGCTNEQISFENSIVAGYTNPNSPADYRCHVFHANGGGMVFKYPPKYSTTETAPIWPSSHGIYVFTGSFFVDNIGTNHATSESTELSLYLPFIREGVCEAYNRRIGLTAPASQYGEQISNFTGQSSLYFAGSYNPANSTNSVIGKNATSLSGRHTACFRRNDTGGAATTHYVIYYVLVTR